MVVERVDGMEKREGVRGEVYVYIYIFKALELLAAEINCFQVRTI